MNRVCLVGRLGAPPEARTSQGGMEITKFRLATNRGFGDKKKTDWHNVVTFGKLASACAAYLDKGLLVSAVTYNSFQGADGQQRTFCDILADEVTFLERVGRRDEQRAYAPADNYGPPVEADTSLPDDMPF